MRPFDLTQLQPFDEHNQRLMENVRPADWQHPTPSGRYHLVVLGAGTAGLVAAAGAAGLGAKVALVERELMGGDCLNVGCVPSKALISAARTAARMRRASDFGIRPPDGVQVDFPLVMQRMRRLRASISPHDSAHRFRELGVDVFFGSGRFVNSNTVDVDGQKLNFKRAVIATGSRAAVPAISGLDDVPYLTNDSVFSLTELPARLGVIGAGPIGCELAQSFAQLGSGVLLVESEHGILPREDRAAAAIVQEALLRDGVRLLCCGRQLRLYPRDGVRLEMRSHDQQYNERVDKLLVAAGRAANVDQLNLECVGVDYDRHGVKVDDRLRTTHPRIFAAGDVCSPYRFTHAADFMARIVIQNALFRGRKKASALKIPWCTYTWPELAHVGLCEDRAQQEGVKIDTYTEELKHVDRAILDGRVDGFVKVHVKRATDRILGATVVADNAGDLISEITLAMTSGVRLSKLGGTIHPYPTHADAIRRLGDQYSRTRLTPLVSWAFHKWLSWTR